jgi:hypothetical protein
MTAITLNTRIAAARRTLKRLQEDTAFFLKRIEEFTPEQKALAMTTFNKGLKTAEEELTNLLVKLSIAQRQMMN